MAFLDVVKAAGLAILISALNLLAAFGAVFLYARFVEPGHPQAFDDAAAPRIVGWSAPVVGALLFLTLVGRLSRRRRARNALAFAVTAWLAYMLLDVGSGAAMGGLKSMLTLQMAASMGLALLGALAVAGLANRRLST